MSLTLSIFPRGTADQPRFLLANQSKMFWTGKGWSDKEADAMLLYDENECASLCEKLHRIENLDRPVTKFVAPGEVEVYGDADFDEVQLWLMRAARLYVDYKQAENKDAILKIRWSKLQKVEQ